MAQPLDATGDAEREAVLPTGGLGVAVLAVSSLYRVALSGSYFWGSGQSSDVVPLEPESKEHAVPGEKHEYSPGSGLDPKATAEEVQFGRENTELQTGTVSRAQGRRQPLPDICSLLFCYPRLDVS